MKSMKKVEVVIESVYVNRLFDLLKMHDITSYTLIPDIQGCGGHGLKMADNVTDVFSNDYIFVLIDESKLLEIKEDIREFTKKYGGKCIITDAMVILSNK